MESVKASRVQIKSEVGKGVKVVFKIMFVVLISILLASAKIINNYYLFSLPLFALIYSVNNKMALISFLTIFAISFFTDPIFALELGIMMLIYLIIVELINYYSIMNVSYIPLIAFFSYFGNNILFSFLENTPIFFLDVFKILYLSITTYVISYIFLKATSFVVFAKKEYEMDEVLSALFILGVALSFFESNILTTVFEFIIIFTSFYGGLVFGVVSSIILGIILILNGVITYDYFPVLILIAILVYMIKDGGKILTSLVYLFYHYAVLNIFNFPLETTFWYSRIIMLILFILIPKKPILKIAKLIKGTDSFEKRESEYLTKVRNLTVKKIKDFSYIFNMISHSLNNTFQSNLKHELILDVYKNFCKNCSKNNYCWNKDKGFTYNTFANLFEDNLQVSDDLKFRCLRFDKLISYLEAKEDVRQIKKSYYENLDSARNLVSDQLLEVSKVMMELSSEIEFEFDKKEFYEELIRSNLESYNINVLHLDVNFEDTIVGIKIILSNIKYDEIEKIIIPILSAIFKEGIELVERKRKTKDGDIYHLEFTNRDSFCVDVGYFSVSKNEKEPNGDTFTYFQLPNKKFIVALSDGMGSGRLAAQESKETIRLLEEMIKTGISEKSAIKTLNTIMTIRAKGEVFSTIDFASINLKNGKTTFLKVGAAPTFIRKRSEVVKIIPQALPVGIIKGINIDRKTVELNDDDLIIMMSDGFYDINPEILEKEILKIETKNPHEFARFLSTKIIKEKPPCDDITLIVMRFYKLLNKWRYK